MADRGEGRVVAADPELATRFKRAEVGDDGRLNIEFHAPGIVELANQAVALLEAHDAKNYVQFEMMPRVDRGVRPVRVTVQWAAGMSPSERAAMFDRGFQRLAAALAWGSQEPLTELERKLIEDVRWEVV